MREEILRMDRVTYLDHGVKLLDNLHFQMFRGEIMGLVPLDSVGLDSFLLLLRENRPLLYGHIYIQDKKVNSYAGVYHTENNVQIINDGSGLVDYLSAADNVFALRRGYRSIMTSERIFREQLEMVESEFGIEIDPSKIPGEMTIYERYVTEIMKALVSGARIVVLREPSSVLNTDDMERLYELMAQCAEIKGLSFIYISAHRQELMRVCSRVTFMAGGRTLKVVRGQDLTEEMMDRFLVTREDTPAGAEAEDQEQEERVLRFKDVTYRNIRRLSFSVRRGECLVIYDYGRQIDEDLIRLLSGSRPSEGTISFYGRKRKRGRHVGIILEDTVQTMLFGSMSCEDNLCMTLDDKIGRIWRSGKARKKIAQEIFGSDSESMDVPVKRLSTEQKYRLVYERIMLQKPEVVFCFHPFQNLDVQISDLLRGMMTKMQSEQISVVIVTVNPRDVLRLADRMLMVRGGRQQGILTKEDIALMESQ